MMQRSIMSEQAERQAEREKERKREGTSPISSPDPIQYPAPPHPSSLISSSALQQEVDLMPCHPRFNHSLGRMPQSRDQAIHGCIDCAEYGRERKKKGLKVCA
jgi:hypothetical protein